MSAVQFTTEELAKEEWRDVIGHPGYQVSDLGRIRSNRPCRGSCDWRLLKPSYNVRTGYASVTFNGTSKEYVHRHVLLAFVGPCPDGMESLHGDDDPANNRVGNLEWGTHRKNGQDMSKRGRATSGQKHGGSILTDDAVIAARKEYENEEAVCHDLAKKNGVSRVTMMDALAGRTFKHLVGAVNPKRGYIRRRSGIKVVRQTSALPDSR